MSVTVTVDGLGKRYRIGAAAVRRETLASMALAAVAAPLRNYRSLRRLTDFDSQAGDDVLWAIRNVSFELADGEVLGIIGRNGSGKSTLLKILSRTVEPTEGTAVLRGRTASLLEVGTGFHNDLTGRENVYLNGSILGMRRHEIDSRFDEIVEFAGLQRFIDTPVKRYSSGMYLRLAFSVAAHLDSDILMADEVLAVGDAEFQRKCLRKMRDVASGGRTVIFVSHNKTAVAGLCNRAIWLEAGQIRDDDSVESVLGNYLAAMDRPSVEGIASRIDREGDGRVRITNIELLDAQGEATETFVAGKDARVVISYESQTDESLGDVHATIAIESVLGERVGLVSSSYSGDHFPILPRRGRIECLLPRLPLNTGEYTCTVWINVGGRKADHLSDAMTFAVEALDYYGSGGSPGSQWGYLLLENSWRIDPPRSPT